MQKTPSVLWTPFFGLTGFDRRLIVEAVNVRRRSYAPYSGYLVGAAIAIPESTLIFSGCNVENATYNALHAEKNAIGHMVAAGYSRIAKVCVFWGLEANIPRNELFSRREWWEVGSAPPKPDVVCPCCGQCLQDIWEFCGGDPDVELIELFSSGWVATIHIGDALPFRFGPEALSPGRSET